MSLIEKIVLKNHEKFITSNNLPFNLSGEDFIWIVVSGSVDIFFVESKEGKPIGKRQHLFRVETGNLLFGFPDNYYNTNFMLLCVGIPGTEVIKISLDGLKAILSESNLDTEISSLIENWVNKLAEALTKNIYPKPDIDLFIFKSDNLKISPKSIISVKKQTLWLENIDEKSLFIDSEFITGSECFLFPLSKDVWINSQREFEIKTYFTSEIIRNDKIWSGIEKLHELSFICYAQNLRLEIVDDYVKLIDIERHRKNLVDNSLREFISVMEEKFESGYEKIIESDPLISSIKTILKSQDIAFNLPEGIQSSKYKDPIYGICSLLRIRYRQVVLTDKWYEEDNGPLLAFQELNQRPVAIIPISYKRYKIIDPVNNTSNIVTAEIAKTLSAFAFVLYKPFPEKTLSIKEFLKFGVVGSKNDFLSIVVISIISALVVMLQPILTGSIYNWVIPEASRGLAVQVIFAMIVSVLANLVFIITRNYSINRIKTRTDVNLQTAFLDKLLKLPISFFKKYSAGELTVRVNSINEIRQLLSGVTVTKLVISIFSLLNFALLFYYSFKMAVYSFVLIVVILGFMSVLGILQLKNHRNLQMILQKIQGLIYQFLTGIAKIRSSDSESSAFVLWAEKFKKLRQIQFSIRKNQNTIIVFSTVFPLVSLIVLFLIMGNLVKSDPMSIGDFIAFLSAYSMVSTSVLAISLTLQEYLVIIPKMESLKPVLEAVPEVDNRKIIPKDIRGDIEINHLAFRYEEDAPLVLKDISLTIQPGEFVAFVGQSGAGKSTLLRLLLGFEKPSSGSIFYDGQDIKDLDISSIRRQIGTLIQNARVLPGTILKNIVGAATDLTVDDAWEAAKLVGLEDDIKAMPMGMFSLVMEGGGTFSGGQRQRLLLARAIVRKPKILFLDEATSALDNKTQEVVSRSLEKLKVTRVVIAHRLSTIINADRIFVIDKGEVAESGSYQQLMDKNGLFAEIAKRQIV